MTTRDVRLANESWEALLAAQSTVLRGFEEEQIWQELSLREYDVLYALVRAGCALRQNDLVEQVLLSQSALSRLIDRLDQRGLVTRAVDPSDRRSVRVALTEQGVVAQRRVGTAHARSVEHRMRALTPDQQRLLRDLCERLTRREPADLEQE